ncbi:NAD(P)-dependent alcohol dehydrogenase [Paenibacillus mucilaginosus]|uniref:AdhA n=1 Tax=Paenibacillus mucilaginosus (strain KNP414) TaxID=1036673 RepID=F8FBN5_PAEMK|nr:NAD(P)-dependent alcohol dehydrogenase [Paenibacillus mucilaginosus]AEI43086.1 AdhA [Paenibacillus mucilaginosus KNP414]MCG7212339.1 NAD(P)-dependent alcohol dehydrogenase [Paenibacillus mucilaginosus]WDM24703.1 NAD(P)-dependent alcohol dehydrogenase [Paenibacillus mucilaginosus]
MKAHSLCIPSTGAPLEHTVIERRGLREEDLLIDIQYSGICHSDIHQGKGDWGGGIFPMVPGHEIVGTVAAVGTGVTKFSVGDRVGVGCFVNSCGECKYCLAGEEQFCQKGVVFTYNAMDYDGAPTYGGYSQSIVVTERFVVRIPDRLSPDAAAPLLCAGITTYSPLKHWHAGPGKKVAIVGMGGLGHLAVQFARAMGAEVTVLSQSASKQEEALQLGARSFYSTRNEETFSKLAGAFDLMINTVSASIDINAYLSLLSVDGTLVNVGLPVNPDSYHAFPLIMSRRSISGSFVGGIRETQEMLDFCAEHGIAPMIEVIGANAEEVQQAWTRVEQADVRYRFVIDTSTFPQE